MRTLHHLALACSLALGAIGSACLDVEEPVVAHEAAYPSGPYGFEVGATLPDLRFQGARADGTLGEVALGDYHSDRGSEAALLVIQVSGGLWCGTCLWYGENTDRLVSNEIAHRVSRLDVVIGDRDNAPARAADALAWQATFGLTEVAVVADPSFEFRPILGGVAAVLPVFILVDQASMRVMRVLDNPSPTDLSNALEASIATLDGREAVEADAPPLVDGLFTENEWAVLSTITVPNTPPADPSNAVSDSAAARVLGEALYFDSELSPSGKVSCATCHNPDTGFSDDRAIGQGVSIGDRRTQGIALSAHARWQFWDGRSDSLWSQALGPFENPTEFDSSRVFVARQVIDRYGASYLATFGGALPKMEAWPDAGKPGDASYEAMSEQDRLEVTRVFVNVGKAIAAYERSFRVKESPLDRYLAGDRDALTPEAKYGLRMFAQTGCLQCHWGPRMTDDAFHNTRTPTGHRDGSADPGRKEGWKTYRESEFARSSAWSDAPESPTKSLDMTEIEALEGQFKTPPLRGVANLTYFGHGGAFEDLAGITEAYGRGGVPENDASCVGTREPWLVNFGETAAWGLVPLLEVLTADPVD